MGRSFSLMLRAAAARLAAPSPRKTRKQPAKGRTFRIETLEPRIALAAAGLVPIGYQPTGPLTGKIVYTSGGHGIEYEGGATNGGWLTDRPEYSEIVEDFGNQDQLAFFTDYLLRAGATVVPMRPIGHQLNEVVLDNDSAGVTFSGSWLNSTTGGRWYDEDYGAVADSVRFRYASTNASAETAVATYTPNIPEEGFYPVYVWASAGTDRTNQLYKVNHSGGQTQLRVDHSKVGNGWIYLGTYHFNAGSSSVEGSVQISNQGTAGKFAIADAVRFGNGMGDLREGSGGIGTGTVSGYPREDESSYYWLYRGIGLGVTPTSVLGTGNVSAPSNMAQHMNQNSNPFGTSVYIGFHSNGTTGNEATATARGAIGLYDNTGAATPHQTDLALFTGRQINQDMQALNGVFEYNWINRTGHSSGGEFGEIDLGSSAEFDATIIEVGFHDQAQDSRLLRDPKIRDQIGRSTYEAVLEYFDAWGGLTSPVTVASAPINVSAVSDASGQVTISWNAGPTGVYGDAAAGFRIYASTNGYGFDGGTYVAGGATTSLTLSGYDPTLPYYFKVVAVNAGGESKGSEVLTALPSGGAKQVLVVNGYDRLDRNGNERYPYYEPNGNLTDRVRFRYNNTYDYVVQVAAAIHASSSGVHVASASNEAVINGSINLSDYDAVIWILGEESTVNRTFDATEQAKVEAFIAGGGHLFLSGSEIGWDLDQSNNGRTFYESTLKGNYVSDDAGTYNVTATAGGIFAGLSFSFDNGTKFYDTDYPDVIAAQSGASLALSYSGGTGGGAAIQAPGAGGRGSVVMLAFPFETITNAANRAAVMDRVLDFFNVAPIVPTGDFNGDGIVDGNDFLAWQRNYGKSNPTLADGDADQNGVVDAADLATWKAQFGTSGPAAVAPTASFSVAPATTAEQTAAAPVETPSSPTSSLTSSALVAPRSEGLLPWLAQRPHQPPPNAPTSRHDLNALRKLRHAEAAPSSAGGPAATAPTTASRRHMAWEHMAPTIEAQDLDLAFSDKGLASDEWLTRY